MLAGVRGGGVHSHSVGAEIGRGVRRVCPESHASVLNASYSECRNVQCYADDAVYYLRTRNGPTIERATTDALHALGPSHVADIVV